MNELSPHAMESYLRNRQALAIGERKELREHDIANLTDTAQRLNRFSDRIREYVGFDPRSGDIDLVVGGPPCQGFSGIGHRRSYAVEKQELPSNRLYRKMAEVIRHLRPRIFLFENVRGLLFSRWTAGGDLIWPEVFDHFRSLTSGRRGSPLYQVRWQLVHAKHYGVPQNRPRVLLVGVRSDMLKPMGLANRADVDAGTQTAVHDNFLPSPGPEAAPDLVEVLGDLIDPAFEPGMRETLVYPTPWDRRSLVSRYFRESRDRESVARKGDPITEHQYSRHSPSIVKRFDHMRRHDGEIPKGLRTKKFAQRVLPERWDEKGPTVTATSLPDDYVHWAQNRTLTVREWARLQTFPDWYEFSGPRTTGGLRRAGNPLQGIFERDLPRYTQIGNAVPVFLARSLGVHFRELLDLARA